MGPPEELEETEVAVFKAGVLELEVVAKLLAMVPEKLDEFEPWVGELVKVDIPGLVISEGLLTGVLEDIEVLLAELADTVDRNVS